MTSVTLLPISYGTQLECVVFKRMTLVQKDEPYQLMFWYTFKHAINMACGENTKLEISDCSPKNYDLTRILPRHKQTQNHAGTHAHTQTGSD